MESRHDLAIDSLPDLATPLEVAPVLRCKPRWVSDQIKAGRLAGVQIAGKYLVTREAVREFIKGCAVPCQSRTEGQASNGGKIGMSGKSSGMSVADSAAEALAQEAAMRLIKRSVASSWNATESRPAHVIRQNAGSRKSSRPTPTKKEVWP